MNHDIKLIFITYLCFSDWNIDPAERPFHCRRNKDCTGDQDLSTRHWLCKMVSQRQAADIQ